MDWKEQLEALKAGGNLPEGKEPENNDAAQEKAQAKPVKRKLKVSIDRKGRHGKTATIIEGFTDDDNIEKIAADLKKKLGTGGSTRGNEILIQGDRKEEIEKMLS